MRFKALLGVVGVAVTVCVGAGVAYQASHLEQRMSAGAVEQRTRIKPTLIAAVAEADGLAREKARTELLNWRKSIMARVDDDFLNWYFSYVEWRWSGLKWLSRRVVGGKEFADNRYLEETAAEFAGRVASPEAIDAEMDRIAEAAATTYYNKLATAMADIRRDAGERIGLVDAELQEVSFEGREENGQRVYVTLYEVAATDVAAKKVIRLLERAFRKGLEAEGRSPNAEGLTVASVAASVLSPVVAEGASKTAIAMGASKATASTIGFAASAVFVVAVIAVEEWWSHGQHVEENRPRLRRQIEASIDTFIEAALRDNGRIGTGVHVISAGLRKSIESQESVWGIVTTNTKRALSI